MTHTHDDHEHCRDLAERLSELVDGELPDDLRREIETHLGDCADCERFVTSLKRVRELGHAVPGPELEPGRLEALREKVRARLEAES
jgi:anti-sigma factor RsiW